MDDRFTNILKDPRYKKVPKNERKVKIDSRFQQMFTDERFHTKFSFDKRGKPIHEVEKEDLQKFYEVEDTEVEVKDEEEKEDAEDKSSVNKKDKKKKKKKDIPQGIHNMTKEKDTTKKKKTKKITKKEKHSDKLNSDELKISFDDIRGENVGDSSQSDNDDDVSDIEIKEEELQEGVLHGWGALDEDANRIENAETHRLAVCNCDWDKVQAVDLYVLFNSLKPTGSVIKSVKVYPSEFGLERMKEEEINGPKELRDTIIPSDAEEEEETVEGTKFHMEKLREYQLNRLKYYYAVVECDSLDTASKIYEECDGLEFETSSTRLDLRFIPDGTTFDNPPKSQADQMPNVKKYEPANFMNTALQQSTVRLTWDESDNRRMEATMKQFTQDDLENMDFKDYIASSSEDEMANDKARSRILGQDVTNGTDANLHDGSSDEDEEDARIRKYRSLMQDIVAKEQSAKDEADENNMEVDWESETNKKEDDEDIDDVDDDVNDDVVSNDDIVDEGTSSDDKEMSTKEGFNDPFFKDLSSTKSDPSKKKLKKKMKKKRFVVNDEDLTEEEKRNKKELELLVMDESEDKKHFSLQKIMEQEKLKKSKKKRRKNKELATEEVDTFAVDVQDKRFNALYSSHLFALDPSEPHFKKTKATEAILKESQRRRESVVDKKKPSDKQEDLVKETSLSALVESVKSKTQSHQVSRKRKKFK